MSDKPTILTHSEQIHEIAAALAKAQGEIEGASKASINPHFRSKYADLAAVWDAVRGPLSKQGIAVVQVPYSEGVRISVETMLLHASGQWMKGVLSVTAKDEGPQAAGSCITYLRRYMLQSFAGVAPEDDDGEGAEGRKPHSQPRNVPEAMPEPKGFSAWLDELATVADQGLPALQAFWRDSDKEHRLYLLQVNRDGWEALKARAEAIVIEVAP